MCECDNECFCKEVKEIINMLWVMLVDGLTGKRTRKARKILFTLEAYACGDMTFEEQGNKDPASWVATPRMGIPGVIIWAYSREIYIRYRCDERTVQLIKKKQESASKEDQEWAKQYIVCGNCYINRCELINSLAHEAVHARHNDPEGNAIEEEYEGCLVGEQAARALGCSDGRLTKVSKKKGLAIVKRLYRGAGLKNDKNYKPIESWKLPRSKKEYREIWSKKLFGKTFKELKKYWKDKTGLTLVN
ncbi:hypothetical protein [Polaribacter sp.]|uniref:hypothetical protein n=1 Tax=Polaribacter sp. TaxID=1920175 RepID=UPI003EF8BE40